jgi:hypothetical protein
MSKKNAGERKTHGRMVIVQWAAQGRGEMPRGNGEKFPPQDWLKPSGLPHHVLCSEDVSYLTASSPATKPHFCIMGQKNVGTKLR